MSEQPKIQIKIENKQNIELIELVQMMNSFNDEYHRFIKQNDSKNIKSDCRLYVEKISDGSIIIEIVEKVLITLPILPGFTTNLIEYYDFLINLIEYLIGKSEKTLNSFLKKEDFSNIKKFFSPIANIAGNAINLTLINNGHIHNNNYTSIEANAVQNACDKEIKKLEKCGESLIRENVELLLYQARDSNLSRGYQGNMGVIREISEKPKVLTFANDRLRYDLTRAESNPFKFVYNVDVEIKLKEGSPFLKDYKDIKEYEILKLHGVVNNDDIFKE